MEQIAPIDMFVARLAKARQVFGETTSMGGGRHREWLEFLESKTRAYDLLIEGVPQAKDIPEFWRTAQYFSGAKLKDWLTKAVQEVVQHNKCGSCDDTITWPKRFCEACAAERQVAAKQRSSERAAVKQALRKCECGARLEPRRRCCDICAKERRRKSIRVSREKK